MTTQGNLDGQGGSSFAELQRAPRLSDSVAAAILESIVSGQRSPGDLLPAERQLAAQFGVSRSVVREATQALSARGVLEVRTGSGVRVAAVDPATVSDAVRLFVSTATLEHAKLHEVRTMLELTAARLAAERRTAEDLARMRACLERMEESLSELGRVVEEDGNFHRAIAAATQNELFVVLYDSIANLLVGLRRENLARGKGPREISLKRHREVFARIEAGDPAGARRRMAKHLEEVQEMIPTGAWGGGEASG